MFPAIPGNKIVFNKKVVKQPATKSFPSEMLSTFSAIAGNKVVFNETEVKQSMIESIPTEMSSKFLARPRNKIVLNEEEVKQPLHLPKIDLTNPNKRNLVFNGLHDPQLRNQKEGMLKHLGSRRFHKKYNVRSCLQPVNQYNYLQMKMAELEKKYKEQQDKIGRCIESIHMKNAATIERILEKKAYKGCLKNLQKGLDEQKLRNGMEPKREPKRVCFCLPP